MNEGSDSQAARARRRRRIAGATMAGLAAVGAAVSYTDGLFLVRLAGAESRVAYLYPLLADGLIVIATIAIYDAGKPRPRWATAGLTLGAALTVAMNVAAGAGIKVPLALIDGLVPVVFFVALEIFIGHIRRGRGGSPGAAIAAAPAAPGHPGPPTTDAALAVLLATASQRGLAELLGVPRSRVTAWAARVAPAAEGPPAGELTPAAAPGSGRGAGLNGASHA